MKEVIKDLLNAIYHNGFVQDLIIKVIIVTRKFVGTDRRIINNYFDSTKIRKLQIGCGDHILDEWLNSDYSSISKEIIHLNVKKTFPFREKEFDFIFSEHMIEHVSYEWGRKMLSECFRVLKPGGKLRISTPDLFFLIDLYRDDKSSLQKEFITHSVDNCIDYAPDYEDTFVINNYVRAWGHEFIYDEKTLSHLLGKAGFINVTRCIVSESQNDVFRKLENVSRKPTGMIALESLVLEGERPLEVF